VAQINKQLQRMLGQQSTREFAGLRIDPSEVFAINAEQSGRRKNGCLINESDTKDAQAIAKKREANAKKYNNLHEDEAKRIVLPALARPVVNSSKN